MLKPKVGDMVRLKPLLVESVSNDAPAYFSTKRPDNYSYHVHQDMIEEILPRPLAVGDRVRCEHSYGLGKIIAVNADVAWLNWDAGGYGTRKLANLTRVDDAP